MAFAVVPTIAAAPGDYQPFKNFVRLIFTPAKGITVLAARAGNYDGVGTAADGALITTDGLVTVPATNNPEVSPQTGAIFGAITVNTVIAPTGIPTGPTYVFGRGPGRWRNGDQNLFDVKIYDMSMSLQGGLGQTPLVYVAQIAFIDANADGFGDILIGIHNRGAQPVEAPTFAVVAPQKPTMLIDIWFRHSAGL